MILNNLSFKAKHAKITLLLGPNGAGKSTVLKTLFGLLKVRQGHVRLEGREITGSSAKELLTQHGIAFVRSTMSRRTGMRTAAGRSW